MIHVFVATNDAYYPRLKVFAKTLKKHNPQVSLTILHSALSEKNIADFCRFSQKIQLDHRFLSVRESRFNHYKLIHQITVETYYRFLLLDIYPEEERAIWMDIDTVVLGDLSPYYYDDFADNYVIACPGNNVQSHLQRLGLKENGCYFNAGVIVFNLQKIRQDFSRDFLFEAYEKYEDRIRFSDQDVLNIVFADRVKAEPSRRLNYIVMSGQAFSGKQIQTIQKTCAVVHYIRHIKPFQIYYHGRIRFLYLKEMFSVYPLQTMFLAVAGALYSLKPNRKTLENSVK